MQVLATISSKVNFYCEQYAVMNLEPYSSSFPHNFRSSYLEQKLLGTIQLHYRYALLYPQVSLRFYDDSLTHNASWASGQV